MNTPKQSPSLIPKGVTIGLGIFTFMLAIAGYGFRLLAGDELSVVIRHAMVVVSFFMIVFPAIITAGAWAMNKWSDANIQTRNAWTLGWLLSCVAILTIMGQYS